MSRSCLFQLVVEPGFQFERDSDEPVISLEKDVLRGIIYIFMCFSSSLIQLAHD